MHLSLNARVNALLFDCGLAEQSSDENLVSRGRQLASYFDLQFVSVLAVVEDGELLLYGSLKSVSSGAVNGSSVVQDLGITAVKTAADPAAEKKPILVTPVVEHDEKTDEAPGLSICSFSGMAICYLLPFMAYILDGFTFSATSLYFRENDWPLWHLSCVIFVGFGVLRLLINMCFASYGPWVALPVCTVTVLAGIQSLGSQMFSWWPYEYSEPVVIAQLVGLYGAQIIVAVQGICFDKFSYNDRLLQKASRLLNLSVTVGYGTSPFIGGLLFDFGSWKLITIFHCAAGVLLLVLLCIQPSMWSSFESWRKKGSPAQKSIPSDSIVPTQQEQENRKISIWSRPEIARPAFLINCAFFVSVWSYMSEWMLYAIYFREQYGWEDAVWGGIAQMAGDIWGAGMLVVYENFKKDDTGAEASTSTNRNPIKCVWILLTTKPYNLSFILFCWVVCDLGICSPDVMIAVAAQIVMGTVWVFGYQWTIEMNIFLSAGDQGAYLQLQSVTANLMSIGCATSGPAALFLFEAVHPLASFLISAAASSAVLLIYTIGFMWFPFGQPKEQVMEDDRVHAIHLRPESDNDD